MDGWDVKALREFIDFSTLMEEASQRYDAVSQVRVDGMVLSNDSFTKWSAKTKWAKSFYDTKFLRTSSRSAGVSQSGPAVRSAKNTTASQQNCRIYPTQDSRSHMALPTPLEAPVDHLPSSFTAFDDVFANTFNEPLQLGDDLNMMFEDL
jgi:hypothetical protein